MIDVHAHVSVPEADSMARADAGFEAQRRSESSRYRDPATAAYMADVAPEWSRLLDDLDDRAAWMADMGVERQLLSINPGQYYLWADEALATGLVEVSNASLARRAARDPDRFAPVATVALQHPELAVEQLRQAVARHGAVAVQIPGAAGGRELDDPELDRFFSAAEECDVFVLLHPLGVPELTGRLRGSYLNNIVGQPVETTIALSHLVFGGVLDAHPALRVCAVHGGGYLPHYPGRGDHAWGARSDARTSANIPSSYIGRLWFDSLVHSDRVLAALLDAVGNERVVMGTDYPFDMGERRPDLVLDRLDPAVRDMVATRNALELLGPHAQRRSADAGRDDKEHR